jgi:hydroxymethylbilane synthase
MSSSSKTIYRLGTRGSALAKAQSGQVLAWLKDLGIHCELVEVESKGDRDHKTPLYEIEAETPGLFTKQLEFALLEKQIDLAVHSLKDLPTLQPLELLVAAIPRRVESGDCLILRQTLFTPSEDFGLPKGARVGTSSLRREAELLSQRPDLKIEPIRGNVPTRVQAVCDGKVDAVVLAKAGLLRLGLTTEGVAKVDLPEEIFVPAPAQGALAIETGKELPADLEAALRRIHHADTAEETRIERDVLRGLHGGCTLPLGVRCVREGDRLHLKAFLGLERERRSRVRQWLSFHHFDLSETDEQILVEKTVGHFRSVMDGAR